HPEAITDVEQVRRGRVVRRADRVEAGCLEKLDLALLGSIRRDRAQRSVIMVDAAAVDLDPLAVELEANRAVPHQRPDPERGVDGVDDLAPDEYLGARRVQARGLG